MVDFQKRFGVSLDKVNAPQGIGVQMNKQGSLITAELVWRSGVGQGRQDLDLFGSVIGEGSSGGRLGGLKGLFKGLFKGKDRTIAEVVYHKSPGSLYGAPGMTHYGDSRTPGTEKMALGELETQRYALFSVYQALGNGVGSLRSFSAKVVITDTEGNEVVVELIENHPNRYWCAVALVDLTNPQGYVVRPVERYSKPGTEKSPLLRADGTIEMDKGLTYMFK